MFSGFKENKIRCYSCIRFLINKKKRERKVKCIVHVIINLVTKTILIRSYAREKLWFDYPCNCSKNKIDLVVLRISASFQYNCTKNGKGLKIGTKEADTT